MTARIAYADGRWQAIELDGADIRSDVAEIHVTADADTKQHPIVTFVMQPGTVDIDIDDAEQFVDVGQSQAWLADAIDGLDLDRFAAEVRTTERAEGITPEEATLATLVAWLRRGALK